jgi:hypothetical protein
MYIQQVYISITAALNGLEEQQHSTTFTASVFDRPGCTLLSKYFYENPSHAKSWMIDKK